MKIYRLPRPYLWLVGATKLALTIAGAVLYIRAVTHPTPLPARLTLLAGLATFGWLAYVRLPKMPTAIAVSEDGSIDFNSRRGTMRVRAGEIRSIRRGFLSLGRGSVKVRHARGRLRMANRFPAFYDFLATVKAANPGVAIKGF